MKIVLIQPYYFNIWESMGLGYIGAWIKENFQNNVDVEFYQGYFDNHEKIIEGCKNADIVAFSVTSPVFHETLELATKIKKVNKSVRIVLGGWHPTAVPNDCLKHDQIDLIAEEIRECHKNISKITGKVDVDEILDIIFKEFCIGK